MPGLSIAERAANLVEEARGAGRRLTLEEAVTGLMALQTLRTQNVKPVLGQLASLTADQRQLLRTFLVMIARATGANHNAALLELREVGRPKPLPPIEPQPASGLDPADTSERKWIENNGY